MPRITGKIDPRPGATVFVKLVQSHEYVRALKDAGLAFTSPLSVLGLLDTGASNSVVDSSVISAIAPLHRGNIPIHAPSTGPNVVHRDLFDMTLVIGESESPPLSATLAVIESEFDSRGFHALIGRDLPARCMLTFDGPAGSFALSW